MLLFGIAQSKAEAHVETLLISSLQDTIMRTRLLFAFVLLGAVLIAGCRSGNTPAASSNATSSAASSSLSVYLGSQQDSSVTALKASDGSVRWHVQLPGASETRPISASDGMVYVTASDAGSISPPMHTFLYALNASNGSVRWQRETPGAGGIQTVLNGTVYATVSDDTNDPAQQNEVDALSAQNGTMLWQATAQGTSGLGLLVADGAVYVTSRDRSQPGATMTHLYALNAQNGDVRWHAISPFPNAHLLAASDSRLYVEEYVDGPGALIFALDTSTGATRWQFPGAANQNGIFAATLVAAQNGMAYLQTIAGDPLNSSYSYYALHASDGSVQWQSAVKGQVTSQAVLAGQMIYVGTQHSIVQSFDISDGSLCWQMQLDPDPQAPGASVVSVSNGVLYAFEQHTALYAMNTASGARLWDYQAAFLYTTIAAVTNGTIYGVFDADASNSAAQPNQVYALGASDAKLHWQHNASTNYNTPIVG
jgi:outer membrane protein assembly factor BamB